MTDSKASIEIRQLTIDDYNEVVEVQERCYKGIKPWTKTQFRSMLRHFPDGQMAVTYNGRVVGCSNALILDLDEYSRDHTWEEISDNGMIRNHDEDGDTLYGIDVIVDLDYRDMNIGRRLYESRKDLCTRLNLKRILVGGRIPGYAAHSAMMDPTAYCRAVMAGRIYDPVLTFQMRHGFVLKRIIKGYLPEDHESNGYATLLEWSNLEYTRTEAKRKVTSYPVRICCVQYQMRKIANFEEFAQQVEYFVDVASDYKADFVLFPELLTTQLLSFMDEKRPHLAIKELTTYTDQYEELFNRMAIEYNINIIGGSHFKMENDVITNVSYLFRRDGSVAEQSKLHVTPSERRWWGVTGGKDGIHVFETDRGKIAILICYDSEFPELARIVSDMGAQILFVPYCTDERHGFTRVRICSQARAIENQVYVAIAGTVGNIPSVENMDIQYAQSAIFTPSDFPFARDGVAAIAEENAEMIVIADVDLELLRRARHQGTVTPFKDRRHDLYSIHRHMTIQPDILDE